MTDNNDRVESESLHITGTGGLFWLNVAGIIAAGGMAFLFALRVVG